MFLAKICGEQGINIENDDSFRDTYVCATEDLKHEKWTASYHDFGCGVFFWLQLVVKIRQTPRQSNSPGYS